MLPVHIEGTDVLITETLPSKNGSPLAASAVEYAVFDETGSILSARQAVPGWTAGNITLEIPAAINTLPANVSRGLRIVEFYITTVDGTFKPRQRYIVQTHAVLEVRKNSFQTLDQAYLTAMDIPDLTGWSAADDNQKIAAMVMAHQQICRLQFRYLKEDNESQIEYTYRISPGDYVYISRMALITENDWQQTPERFKTALRRAQLVEADLMLAGDPVRDKRLNGIISETIGESKMFFNARPPLSLAVSRKSLEILSGYFYYSNQIARA